MFISNMFMDEILTLLFFLTNVTNKKGVKTCFMISNLSFGLANVFTHVAAKQWILMFIISMSLKFLNWCTFKFALITLNQLVRFTAISCISIQLSLSLFQDILRSGWMRCYIDIKQWRRGKLLIWTQIGTLRSRCGWFSGRSFCWWWWCCLNSRWSCDCGDEGRDILRLGFNPWWDNIKVSERRAEDHCHLWVAGCFLLSFHYHFWFQTVGHWQDSLNSLNVCAMSIFSSRIIAIAWFRVCRVMASQYVAVKIIFVSKTNSA